MADETAAADAGDAPTEPIIAAQASDSRSTPRGIVLTVEMVLGVLAAALVIFGSFGSWASIGPLDVSGIRGDGVITLAAGIVAVLFVGFARWPVVVLVAAVAACATAVYDVAHISSLGDDVIPVAVGWGLVAALIGAVGLVAWSLFELARRPDRRLAWASGAVAGGLLAVVLALAIAGTFADPEDADTRASSATPAASAVPSEADNDAAPGGAEATPPATPVLQIGGQIHLSGANGLRMVATVERVIDPVFGGEYDEPEDGKRYVGVMLRLTNNGTVPYDDSPSNGATLTYGDDREATTSSLSEGECAGGFATGAKISPGSKRKGCIVFEVPASNTIKTFQLALDSGFADQTGEWNVRPANRTATGDPGDGGGLANVDDDPTYGDDSAEPLRACDQNISRGAGSTCDYANTVFKRYAARLQEGAGPDMTVEAKGISSYCSYDGADVSCSGDNGQFATFPKWAADVY